MDRTQNLKPWPKGVSGNPSGRPKRDLAAELAIKAFESLEPGEAGKVLARMLKKNPKMYQVLADRAFGKVPQALQISGQLDVSA
jgi:hypothetical protein